MLSTLIVLGLSSCDKEESGGIYGRVTDINTGESIDPVNIYVNGPHVFEALTIGGQYKIEGVPKGTYTVTASKISGHYSRSIDIYVDDTFAKVDFALIPK